MQKITQLAASLSIIGLAVLSAGCSSARPEATQPEATRPAPSMSAPVSSSPSAAATPVVADRVQSAFAGAAAFTAITHRGRQPSAETCAAEWNELSPSKQASLDRAGFDAGCYGDSKPETITFDAGSTPSPSTTP
ncbi:hypothetical protein [Streptomyces rubellomurinus]|uniref:hypothetical protein n=1 Tax=Streptomyces rubellomurinus (strain ATCC 31215) TaxID=359131 RepID=UPI0012FECDB6|nr:hypothetical protein [Streptomyces rubellomurinus]